MDPEPCKLVIRSPHQPIIFSEFFLLLIYILSYKSDFPKFTICMTWSCDKLRLLNSSW